MQPIFSVILNTYDSDQAQRHATIACIAAITKFTSMPYELIVVDNEPRYPILDDYKVFDYKHIMVEPKETVYTSYNWGAMEATTDYLFFIQNDVFVHEHTLDKLWIYLGKWEMVFPQQHEIKRSDAVAIQETPDGEETTIGQRDAGLLGITRKAFDRAGGWDERFRNMLGEAAFYSRCDAAGVSWTDRTNAIITHIKAGNNLRKPSELYTEEMDFDAALLKKEYSA